MFVANQVAHIHSRSDNTQWRHDDGKVNVADIGSGGLLLSQVSKIAPWLTGL